MLLHDFDPPVPWKQSKMSAKHIYLKSLKLQTDCRQINFLFTVSTNIMLFSLLPRILWLLCLSFILLYYLYSMLVKMIPIIFEIGIKLKRISPSTNRLVTIRISAYTNTTQTFKTLSLLKAEPWGLQLRKWCKSENVRKRT